MKIKACKNCSHWSNSIVLLDNGLNVAWCRNLQSEHSWEFVAEEHCCKLFDPKKEIEHE